MRDQYIADHNWYMALEMINDMIAVEKKASFYTRRAMIWIKLQESRKAMEDLKLALVINPKDELAQQTLKKISFNKAFHDNSIDNTVVDSHDTSLAANHFSVEKTVADINEDTTPPAATIGDRYKILEKLGQGGMGKVYKSYDTHLERIVALKTLISQDSRKQNERFLREAKAIAQLHHPNIIAIHDISSQNGQNFFTMDFIEGTTLKIFVEKHNIGIPHKVKLIEKIAKALSYAHKNGIIHRDIKPSNIMVNINHEPILMDFGLAKITGSEDGLSRTGDAIGTPAYMPIEQIQGEKVDARADIYSLGTTLYEILMGRAPFQGESYYNILHQVLHSEPVPMRDLNPDIPIDLEAICMKCLEKNRNKRYPDMQSFIGDLQNFLMNRPVNARPITRWTQLQKFIYRHQIAVTVSSLILCVIIGLGVFSFVSWKKAEKQELQRRLESQSARKQLAEIALAKAAEAFARKEWKQCAILAAEGLHFVRDSSDTQAITPLKQKLRNYATLAVKQSGLMWEKQQPATFSKALYTSDASKIISYESELAIWDAQTGKILHYISHHLTEYAALSHNDRYLAYATKETGKNEVRVLSVDDGQVFFSFAHNSSIQAIQFAHQSMLLSVAYQDASICVWDIENKKMLHKFKTIYNNTLHSISSIQFVHNDDSIAFPTSNAIIIHNLHTQKQTIQQLAHQPRILVYHPLTQNLAIGCKDMFYIWNLSQKTLKKMAITVEPMLASFNRDGNLLCYTGTDFPENEISMYATYEKTNVLDIASKTNLFTDFRQRAIFHPKKNELLLFSEDYACSTRNINDSTAQNSAVMSHSLSINPSSTQFVRWLNGNIEFSSLKSGKIIKSFPTEAKQGMQVVFSPDEKYVASYNMIDSDIYLWNMQENSYQQLQGHKEAVNKVVFHPHLPLLASCEKKAIIIWNLHNNTHQVCPVPQAYHLFNLAFNDDGTLFAVEDLDKFSVQIWNTQSKKCIHSILLNKDEQKYSNFAEFTFKGIHQIMCVTHNGFTYSYHLKTHKLSKSSLNIGDIQQFILSKNNHFYLVVNSNGKLHIYNTQNNKLIQTHEYSGLGTIFYLSPDAKFLLSESRQGIKCYRLFLQSPTQVIPLQHEIKKLKILPDENLLVHQEKLATFNTSQSKYTWHLPQKPQSVSFSRHGKYVAIYGIDDLQIRDTQKDKQLWYRKSPTLQAAFSPQEKTAAVSENQKYIVFHDLNHQETMRIPYTKNIRYKDVISFNRNGVHAAVIYNKNIVIWDISTQKIIRKIPYKDAMYVSWSADNRHIITSGPNVTIYDIFSQDSIIVLDARSYVANFDNSGKYVIFMHNDNIKIFDIKTRQIIYTKKYKTFPSSLAMYGDTIAAVIDGKVTLLNYKTSQENVITEDKGPLSQVMFVSQNLVAIHYHNNPISIWDIHSRQQKYQLPHSQSVQQLFIHQDTIITYTKNSIYSYSIAAKEQQELVTTNKDIVGGNPQGTQYITTEHFNFLHTIDLSAQKKTNEFRRREVVNRIAFSSEDIIVMQLKKEVVVLNLKTKATKSFTASRFTVSSDGKYLAVLNKDSQISVWNLQNAFSFQKQWTLANNFVPKMFFVGEDFVVVYPRSIHIFAFDSETPKVILAKSQYDYIGYLGHDSTNKVLAAYMDRSLCFFDIETQQQIYTLPGTYNLVSFLPQKGIAAAVKNKTQVELIHFPLQQNFIIQQRGFIRNLQKSPRKVVRDLFHAYADRTLNIKPYYGHLRIW